MLHVEQCLASANRPAFLAAGTKRAAPARRERSSPGIMGCCGDNKVGGTPKSPQDFFLKRRGCTDILCLLFFLLFWGGMGYITYLSVYVGDPYEIFYGSDYMGNRCGRGAFSHLPKVYYPRVEKDLMAQPHIASTQPWRLRFYGLCMSECPNVTQPTDCFANPSHCIVHDYGTPAQYNAAGGSSFYYATIPSVSVLNRCVPKAETTLLQADDRCAFPQCDGTYYAPCDEEYPTTWKLANNYPRSLECDVRFRVGRVEQLKPASSNVLAESVAGYTAGIQRMADSIVESYEWVLVFGLAVPIVLGFIWLVFLRLFAKTFTYIMIFAVGLAMVHAPAATHALAPLRIGVSPHEGPRPPPSAPSPLPSPRLRSPRPSPPASAAPARPRPPPYDLHGAMRTPLRAAPPETCAPPSPSHARLAPSLATRSSL